MTIYAYLCKITPLLLRKWAMSVVELWYFREFRSRRKGEPRSLKRKLFPPALAGTDLCDFMRFYAILCDFMRFYAIHPGNTGVQRACALLEY